jgi:Tol biopolymer transport system component
MTAFDRSERYEHELPDILTAIAAPRVPDYVDDLLAQAAATRQRRRRTIPERLFGMDAIAYRASVPAFPWRPFLVAALLLAFVVGALLVAGSQQRRVPPPFGPAKNGAIAFGEGDIYVRDGIDGTSRLIIGGPTFDFAAGFTRDGQRLVFLRRASGTPGTPSERLQQFVADADGSNVRAISEPLVAPDWADLAPDSASLVVAAGEPAAGQHLFIGDLDRSGHLHQIDLGPNLDADTPNFLGPSGAEIVFRGTTVTPQGVRHGIFAVDPASHRVRPITPTDGTDDNQGYSFPQPSPDGRYVAYTMWDTLLHGLSIHVVSLATGEDRTLTDVGRSEGWATFSPDSTRIFFTNYTTERYQLFISPVDGAGQRLPAGPQYRQVDNEGLNGIFSPDGKWVIVSNTATKETRIVDAAKGGDGEILPWSAADISGWQRLAP